MSYFVLEERLEMEIAAAIVHYESSPTLASVVSEISSRQEAITRLASTLSTQAWQTGQTVEADETRLSELKNRQELDVELQYALQVSQPLMMKRLLTQYASHVKSTTKGSEESSISPDDADGRNTFSADGLTMVSHGQFPLDQRPALSDGVQRQLGDMAGDFLYGLSIWYDRNFSSLSS